MNQLRKWLGTLWGKITALAVGVVALMTVGDFFYKWHTFEFVGKLWYSYLLPVFVQRLTLPLFIVLVLAVVAIAFIVLFCRDSFNLKQYYIPIRARFYHDHAPSEYDRATKWSYKKRKKYYFVPLLSHSQSSVDFVDICGPYCANCHHLLHLDAGEELGRNFFCVNCVRTYPVPRELLGDYFNKLMTYFREEYRQGRVRDNH